jgi:hypothetical protein
MSTDLQQAKPAQTMELVQITALAADLAAVKEILTENLGAGGMSEFDLQKIKIPSGGGIAFEVTDIDGEKAVPKIKAVILFHRDQRAYWPNSLDETGGVAPDCHSNDALVGIGSPGGTCASCPLALFGSAKKGKGQACKQTKQLFVLREGSDSILPEVFSVPPTSLGNFKKLALMLGGRGVGVTGIVVEIGLTKEKNAAGTAYSEATFKPVRILTSEEKTKVEQFAALYKPMMDAAPITIPASSNTGSGRLERDADPAFD